MNTDIRAVLLTVKTVFAIKGMEEF